MFLAPAAFIADPELLSRSWTREESLDYTRWLATHHYENFHVASFLLPKRLHQDFYNVYAFCRWADDLADEIGDTAESLRLLGWWRAELQAMIARENPPYRTVDEWYLFNLVRLPNGRWVFDKLGRGGNIDGYK